MSEHKKMKAPVLEIQAQDACNKLAYLFWSF